MLEVHFMAEENKEIVIVDDKTIQEKIYFIYLSAKDVREHFRGKTHER